MDELIQTFLEEYEGAQEQLEKERYKNAVILFSKAVFALCDILIYHKIGKLPKNHGERFRILQNYFPEVYLIVDSLFGKYTDAYSKPVLKEAGEEIKNGIKKIAAVADIPEEVKRIIK